MSRLSAPWLVTSSTERPSNNRPWYEMWHSASMCVKESPWNSVAMKSAANSGPPSSERT